MFLSRFRPWRNIQPRKDVGRLNCMFIVTSMPVGGAETLLVNMMRRMDSDRFKPELVCTKDPGPLGLELSSEFRVHSNILASKFDPRGLPRLVRLMIKRRTDVVITVNAGDNMFWGRMAAHVAGVPAIAAALHSTGWPDGVGRMNRWLTGITDAFIGVADSHGNFLRDVEKFPAEKVNVIRNGIDCDRFQPDPEAAKSVREELNLPADTPLVGIVAALRSEKNHTMLVRAAAKVRDEHPNAHWIIVGDGPERPAIEAAAAELNMTDRIHLLGTRSDTPRLVAALDVFTLCSLNEASPVSILEALSCEVPVMATNVGSIGESIVEGVTGHMIESEDTDAMAKSVCGLLADPDRRRKYGKAGRELVLKTGSLQSMVAGYEALATQLYDAQVQAYANRYARKSPQKARIGRTMHASELKK